MEAVWCRVDTFLFELDYGVGLYLVHYGLLAYLRFPTYNSNGFLFVLVRCSDLFSRKAKEFTFMDDLNIFVFGDLYATSFSQKRKSGI